MIWVSVQDFYIYNTVPPKKSVVVAITLIIRKRLNYIHYLLFVNRGMHAMYLKNNNAGDFSYIP